MLLEFSCSNHKSIKETISFSMIAGKDNTFEDKLLQYNKYRVLRSSVVYGANGSGKSNFIDAVAFTRNLVLNSIKHQPGDGIRQQLHQLSKSDDISQYAMQFTKNNIRYSYGFTLKNSLVIDEYMFYFPKGRKIVIFERNDKDFVSGDKFKGRFETCRDVLKPNRLFLSCAANFSSVQEVLDAFSFFKDDLIIYRGVGTDNWLNYSLNVIEQNSNVKKAVLDLFNRLGTGIKDINIKHLKQNLDPNSLPPFLADDFKLALLNNKFDVYETKIVYEKFSIDLNSESTGIKKLIEFVCPLLDIINKDKILFCDEIESNLHESIVNGLVNLFRGNNISSQSQMIFTTHDTTLLDLDLFRRDQIWFTELTFDNRATDLYSLAEIKNVRKDENIAKGYILGKYGAIPMLNSDLSVKILNGEWFYGI